MTFQSQRVHVFLFNKNIKFKKDTESKMENPTQF